MRSLNDGVAVERRVSHGYFLNHPASTGAEQRIAGLPTSTHRA
ncbi:hypothetical protein ACPOL_3757 [Acidisarcina polymorpha]|uniref:Uncharacterized protein n=1 Tax=Acidisarcina polymorpha TaxID=2211140 RepID=A0A2Z5G3D2_9BACT|nr:hypothetical protein ACPOL_3757 [Acidisarcina polymorpha]